MIAIGRSGLLYKTLEYMYEKGVEIEAVITDKAYKEYDFKSGDFKELAEKNGSAFFQTSDLASDEIAEFLKDKNSELAISVNWKYVIPESVIDSFRLGILNLHLGNLPDYKGNATPNWAIIKGEPLIWLNVHKMDAELDSGDIIAREEIELSKDIYVGDILKRSEELAPQLFYHSVIKLNEDPDYILMKNSPEGIRCYPRSEEDHQIDWNDSAEDIVRLVRASSRPYSGAYSYINGCKVRIWRAETDGRELSYISVKGQVLLNESGVLYVACGDGVIKITEYESESDGDQVAKKLQSVRTRFRYRYE